jgi:hypothetical protein
MTDPTMYFKAVREGWADPLGVAEERARAARLPEADRLRLRARAEEEATRSQTQAERVDTASETIVEIPANVWSGGYKRERNGSVRLDRDGNPVKWNEGERVPSRLSEQETAAMFGVTPQSQQPSREKTPEEALRESSEAETQRRTMRARFNAIAASKPDA